MSNALSPLHANAFLGHWAPPSLDDSNIAITVRSESTKLEVSAVDVFDGEVLDVSDVDWSPGERQTLRFSTYTPSTDATLDHELVMMPDGKIRHAITERSPRPSLAEELRAAS